MEQDGISIKMYDIFQMMKRPEKKATMGDETEIIVDEIKQNQLRREILGAERLQRNRNKEAYIKDIEQRRNAMIGPIDKVSLAAFNEKMRINAQLHVDIIMAEYANKK